MTSDENVFTLAITVEELCNQISLLREDMGNMDSIRICLDDREHEMIRDTMTAAARRAVMQEAGL